jgi:hypothetical protein
VCIRDESAASSTDPTLSGWSFIPFSDSYAMNLVRISLFLKLLFSLH